MSRSVVKANASSLEARAWASGSACTRTPAKSSPNALSIWARTAWSNAWPCPRARSIAASTCDGRSEEHTSELQSRLHLVCRLLLEKKKKTKNTSTQAHPKTPVGVETVMKKVIELTTP